MSVKPLIRKILKVMGITAVVLLLLLGGAYWWFVHHAESILCDFVRIRSKGTVTLRLKSVAINLRNHRLNLRGAVFYNNDTAAIRTFYQVSVNKLSLQLHSLMPLVLNKDLSIDSILIHQPDITVTKLDTLAKRDGSLTFEIGQFYNSIHKGLNQFSVGYLRIDQGKFTLANQARTTWKPVTLSNIDFYINNFEVNDVRPEDDGKFFFSNNIVFQTHHQALTFPDGKYDMAFSHFRIHVKDKVIEMDSCTFASAGFEQPQTAIRLYFDKLKFTGIDLDALYYTNTLKADSMYAVNPDVRLRLQVNSDDKSDGEPPGIDSLLRQLGMNVQIRYMGVKNISTSLVTARKQQSSSYHTRDDDFELHDIRINQDAAEPIAIGGFNMAIRGYSSLNLDSSYVFKFDSVRFINSKVLLNNFSITSSARAAVKRHHELPLFELDNLSWEELIFNRHIKARQAVLYKPVIHYEGRKEGTGKGKSMYSILHSMEDAMSLEKIRVIDGELIYTPNADIKLQLENVDLTVSTNRLLAARTSSMLGDAVDSLRFAKGSIRTKKWQAAITNGHFTGEGTLLHADKVQLEDIDKRMVLTAGGVQLKGMAFDEQNGHIRIRSLRWREGKVAIHQQSDVHGSPQPLSLSWEIDSISGSNTALTAVSSKYGLSAFIASITAQQLRKYAGQSLGLGKLRFNGHSLHYNTSQLDIRCAEYDLNEGDTSSLYDASVFKRKGKDTMRLQLPHAWFRLRPGSFTKAGPQIDNMFVFTPSVYISHHAQEEEPPGEAAPTPLPPFTIHELQLESPAVTVKQHKEHTVSSLSLQPEAGYETLLLREITHRNNGLITIDSIHAPFHHYHLTYQAADSTTLLLHGLSFSSSRTRINRQTPGAANWNTHLTGLTIDQATLQSPRNNLFRFAALNIQKLNLHSGQSYTDWFHKSPALRISADRGSYRTATNDFTWRQLQYDHQQRALSLDSFAYQPVQSRDVFIASHFYQSDFVQLRTGRIVLRNPDLAGLFRDSMNHIASLHITAPSIYAFRDKRPPFRKGVIKPLPVNLIRQLPFPLQVDTVMIEDGMAQYEELNNKTEQSGKIRFSQLNALLTNIRSRDHRDTDSLRLQASAMLLDSIHVRLGLHESYTDSLSSFVMSTAISPANLTVLNQITIPMASVKIRSGYLDTLSLHAIGREHVSLGYMNMLYRKLNVQLLQADSSRKLSFGNKLITFLANSFVIKSRNEHKTGLIYFERFRDRSFFNYMLKIFISGAGSSIGIKSNKKQLKHYRRALRRQQVPAIPIQLPAKQPA